MLGPLVFDGLVSGPELRNEHVISLSKAFAFVVGYLPSGVLQAAMSINGMVMGPSLGVFSLGAFFPWVNGTGALVGYLCGLGSAIWLYVGSQICPPGKTVSSSRF